MGRDVSQLEASFYEAAMKLLLRLHVECTIVLKWAVTVLTYAESFVVVGCVKRKCTNDKF